MSPKPGFPVFCALEGLLSKYVLDYNALVSRKYEKFLTTCVVSVHVLPPLRIVIMFLSRFLKGMHNARRYGSELSNKAGRVPCFSFLFSGAT